MAASAHEPVITLRTYVIVFVALMLFAALTVALASIDLGVYNTVAALAIAVIKTALVVLFFMHVRYKAGLTRIIIFAGCFWLALLVFFTLADVFTRGWTPQSTGWSPLHF